MVFSLFVIYSQNFHCFSKTVFLLSQKVRPFAVEVMRKVVSLLDIGLFLNHIQEPLSLLIHSKLN